MNKQQIEEIIRYRQTLIDNFEKIVGTTKKSKKLDLSSTGQLDLFSIGFEDSKSTPKLIEYNGAVDLMKWVNIETDLLGAPIIYEPLADKWMYKEVYCTNDVLDLLDLTENTKNIVVMDRVTLIDKRISKAGNNYAKIHLSQLGVENYCYLWGKNYADNIVKLFVNEIYLFLIDYKKATPEFTKDSIIITAVKNIKDVDIDKEVERLKNSLQIIEQLDEPWMIKNRRNDR